MKGHNASFDSIKLHHRHKQSHITANIMSRAPSPSIPDITVAPAAIATPFQPTKPKMPPPKKSGRALMREEGQFSVFPGTVIPSADSISPGLERTDNNLRTHSWPMTPMINQKNYYTSVLLFTFSLERHLTEGPKQRIPQTRRPDNGVPATAGGGSEITSSVDRERETSSGSRRR